jgi:hypothetical protein
MLFGSTRPGLFLGQVIDIAPRTQSKTFSQMQPNERRNASDFDPGYVDGAMLSPRGIKLTPRDALTDGRISTQSAGGKRDPALELESTYDIGVALGITLAEREAAARRLANERGYGSDCSSEYGEGHRSRAFV